MYPMERRLKGFQRSYSYFQGTSYPLQPTNLDIPPSLFYKHTPEGVCLPAKHNELIGSKNPGERYAAPFSCL